MNSRVGTCSICGGDVYGHNGAWLGVNPPPPPTCNSCGATTGDDTIQMTPRRTRPISNTIRYIPTNWPPSWTITMFVVCLLLWSTPVRAQEHFDVVQQAWSELRAAGYNLSDGGDSTPCNNFVLVRLVATRLKSEGAGGLLKPSGTHCEFDGQFYAKDIVAYPDGRIFDIIGTGPITGSFDPHWLTLAPVEPSRWRVLPAFAIDTPSPSPVPDPTPQPPPAPPVVIPIDISAVIAEVRTIYAQNERIFAENTQRWDLLFRQVEGLQAQLKAHDENPGWVKKYIGGFMGNKYVQMAGAAILGKIGLDQF